MVHARWGELASRETPVHAHAVAPPRKSMASSSSEPLALPAPATLLDALPYVDRQYEAMKPEVDAMIAAEQRTFAPRDYLAHLPPSCEPNFDEHPMLQAEWMRVCDRQPMPRIDVSRYQLDAPPQAKQGDVGAWRRAVDNAQAQLDHQGNRICNLELLQQYGANAWRAHLNSLEAASKALGAGVAAAAAEVEATNRKRKAEQTEAGPRLMRLEAEWVQGVKKNLEIESQCLRLEHEVAAMRSGR